MPFNGDMSSLNTIYTSVMNIYSKFVKEIYLYIVAAKNPIQAQNISGDFGHDVAAKDHYSCSVREKVMKENEERESHDRQETKIIQYNMTIFWCIRQYIYFKVIYTIKNYHQI